MGTVGMKNPWMQMFFGDFLANTMHLSASELGAYVLLIAHAWEHDAQVPWDRAQRIARVDNRNWKKVKEKLVPFFEDIGAGTMRHARVLSELAHAAEISRKRKVAAEQMHMTRRAFANANASHPPSHSPKRSYARSKQANGSYRPSGMSPDKGDDYRAAPSPYKSDNVLEPIPDRPQPKPNPKLETLKKKGR